LSDREESVGRNAVEYSCRITWKVRQKWKLSGCSILVLSRTLGSRLRRHLGRTTNYIIRYEKMGRERCGVESAGIRPVERRQAPANLGSRSLLASISVADRDAAGQLPDRGSCCRPLKWPIVVTENRCCRLVDKNGLTSLLGSAGTTDRSSTASSCPQSLIALAGPVIIYIATVT
jgi:hypothetical protein